MFQFAQAIKIKSIERTKGMLRLRFVAGGRVFAAMGRYLAGEAALNKVCRHTLPALRLLFSLVHIAGSTEHEPSHCLTNCSTSAVCFHAGMA